MSTIHIRCGNVKKDLQLSDRVYNCSCCGLTMDRDHNAAVNLRNEALRTIKLMEYEKICISINI